MQHQEIITRLSRTVNTSEAVFTITMEAILLAIVGRLGEKALTLPVDELLLARDEVKIAIDHLLDEREYIDMGLDVWEITRHL